MSSIWKLLVVVPEDEGSAAPGAGQHPYGWDSMRARVALSTAAVVAAFGGAAAVAQAPAPAGNFGGGGLVPPPRDHFGAGNAVIAVRALPGRKLEVEATL